jgi:large subunit ribosomal protein L9
MYIIFTKDLPGVGQTHDLKNVKPGFYRNYLAPHGFAVEATEALLQKLKAELSKKKEKAAQVHEETVALIKKLSGKTITISARASAKGSLFRAISERAILDAIHEEFKIKVEKSALSHEPIKMVGVHPVKVTVGSETVEMNVKVDARGEEEVH